MTKFNDSFEDTLGLPPIVIDAEEKAIVVIEEPTVADEQIDADTELARANIIDAVEQGSLVLGSAVEVAQDSEHPRAFEVVGGLIKNIVDGNLALLDLQTKKKALKERGPKAPESQVTNNNLVMSTDDIQKMLLGDKK